MSPQRLATLDDLIQQARGGAPIRVAVVNAGQAAVLKTLRDAARRGIAEPVLIGQPDAESAFGCAPQPESACCPMDAP